MQETSAEGRLDEIGAEASDNLDWILRGMGIDAEITLLIGEDQVLLNVECPEDSSIAIGRKGQTLEALQVIINRIIAKKFPEVTSRTTILIDIGGYRERRRINLVDMAKRTADEVRETGETAVLDPLNSYERYLVHNALKAEPGIVTSSRGDGTMKQLLISSAEESD